MAVVGVQQGTFELAQEGVDKKGLCQALGAGGRGLKRGLWEEAVQTVQPAQSQAPLLGVFPASPAGACQEADTKVRR